MVPVLCCQPPVLCQSRASAHLPLVLQHGGSGLQLLVPDVAVHRLSEVAVRHLQGHGANSPPPKTAVRGHHRQQKQFEVTTNNNSKSRSPPATTAASFRGFPFLFLNVYSAAPVWILMGSAGNLQAPTGGATVQSRKTTAARATKWLWIKDVDCKCTRSDRRCSTWKNRLYGKQPRDKQGKKQQGIVRNSKGQQGV